MTHLSSQHERFVHLLLIGTAEADAYIEVFGTKGDETRDSATLKQRARALSRVPELVARLHELRAPVIREAQASYRFDLNVAMEKCERAYELAELTNEAGHMLKAVELQAKLTKLLGDTSKQSASVLDEVSTADLVMLLKELKSRREADVVIEAEVVSEGERGAAPSVDCSDLI